MNKKIDKQVEPSFVVFPESANRRNDRGGYTQPGMGDTGIPFTRNCVLETTTASPAFKPELIE
jgi:hypothetical protein